MSKSIESNPDHDHFSFVESEHDILEFWEREAIFQQSLDQTKDGAPYIFYDGLRLHRASPSWAPGGSILKDVVPRYFTMQGRYVQRRFGWDCHGLPIEHEIDKSLGMSSSEAVEKLGVKGYNDECRSIISRYTQEWRKTITVLADGSTLITTTKPWNPGTWSPFGGWLRGCGTRA